jgi:hypothetical protein
MVFFSSKNPTPELPLLESAASELAVLDDLELLPAAAFDVDCRWSRRTYETPATTLPASPHDEDSCSSFSDEHTSADDYKQSHSLVPLWPNAPPRREQLYIKNTFVEVDENTDGASRPRSRAASEFTGLSDLEAQGIAEAIVASFRQMKAKAAEEWYHTSSTSSWEWAESYEQVQYVPMWCPVGFDGAMPVTGGIIEWGTSFSSDCKSEQLPLQSWPVSSPPTTLMLSNLPLDLTQEDLIEILDREEFSGFYDFVFFPGIDIASQSRHAIVNLTEHKHGLDLAARFHGKSAWGVGDAECSCDVSWFLPVQGLSDLIRVYRDAPENHPDAPEECRPQIFSGGWPVSFPIRNECEGA